MREINLRRRMNNKLKDRIVDAVLILIFLTLISATAYAIIKIVTRWTVKGLG